MTKAKEMLDKGVEVELKGKKFEVKFDLNALCNLQDKFGDITQVFSGLEKSDFKKIRSLLHIGLANGENEGMTETDVGALINMKNIGEVVEALTDAFGKSMPEVENEGK